MAQHLGRLALIVAGAGLVGGALLGLAAVGFYCLVRGHLA